MNNLDKTLKGLGLNEKEIKVYLSLLSLGPTAIRKIAEASGINRGSTYEALKTLQKEGLVSYYHKAKHQHFLAEDPKALTQIVERRKSELEETSRSLNQIIPSLSSLKAVTARPVVKFYEGYEGVKFILGDVLDTMEESKSKEYSVYSSSSVRPFLYHKDAFPNFTDERIRRKISVRTIASGAGGSEQGRDKRKWISKKESAPTYTLIYGGKVAMISITKSNIPHGLIIEDSGIYNTQLSIFDSLWKLI